MDTSGGGGPRAAVGRSGRERVAGGIARSSGGRGGRRGFPSPAMDTSGGGRPRAAVVLTGSELVTGVIADANGAWLARELTGLGFEVAHLLAVGDRPDDLAEALRHAAAARCALVVTS